jgi:hypothetical protein
MDPAFQSRIQVGIEYKTLNHKARQDVWTSLLEGKTEIKDDALKEIRENLGSLAKHKLNGRQIRNALNIADGLAYNEFEMTGEMQYKHIVEAVRATLDFQKYFADEKIRSRLNAGSVWAPYRGKSSSSDTEDEAAG